MAKRTKDEFTRDWIIENSVEILSRYEPGVLTGGLTLRHSATEIGQCVAKLKRNQPIYPEILIEKKALEGVFAKPCRNWDIAVGACKGYPSLTFLFELSERLREAQANGKQCVILYFGDYDPSGEDIPRSIGENLQKFGIFGVEIRRIALMEQQVIEWKLPPAPAKETDSRTANWDGLGQVELDAVKPEKLISLLDDAINDIFDRELYDELLERESDEREQFQTELKRYVEDDL